MSSIKKNANQSGQQSSGSFSGAAGQQDAMRDHNHQNATGSENCGPARRVSDIQPHMQVIASCGCNVGKVDHMEGNAIKLTRNDSPDGQHHFIPTSWVNRVDDHVHLNKDMNETQREWKSDAAGCSA